MIGILDVLRLYGFDVTKRVKFVRHGDQGYDMNELDRRGWLEAYQSYQQEPVFDKLDYIISFIGAGGTRARFIGVYKVNGRRQQAEPLPDGCPHTEWLQLPHSYSLQRVPAFDDLKNRVVIEWGSGTRTWHQHMKDKNKEVLELLPKGQSIPLFKDYLEFAITYSELQHIHQHPDANRDWITRLSAVAGVYLVLDTRTGAQYVGSAHGSQGIWGRWSVYAQNGHGGNVKLRNLVSSGPPYPGVFSYSVLQILPMTAAQAEVLNWERLYKQKLGSRATGLNLN